MLTKQFLVCLFLASGALAAYPDFIPTELRDLFLSIRAICTKENGITDADVDSYVISNNAQQMMCYMKCVMLEANYMGNNHQIQYDVIENSVKGELQKILIEDLDKCRSIPDGKDACEKAYNFNVCIQQVDPVHYFLP